MLMSIYFLNNFCIFCEVFHKHFDNMFMLKMSEVSAKVYWTLFSKISVAKLSIGARWGVEIYKSLC